MRRSRQLRESSSSEDMEAIDLDVIPSPTTTMNSSTVLIPPVEQV
jgi:hypothetical protein